MAIGRPREPNARRTILTLRVSEAERAVIEQAAIKAQTPMTVWMRETIVRAAKRKARR